jgi:hypothetical protein
MKTGPCIHCGQLQGVAEYDKELWRLYHLLDDGGRKYIEPLVYTQSDFEDMGYYNQPLDEEDFDAVKLSMERNMMERGLCPECGRPNLAGKTEKDFMSEEDAQSLHDMYKEMAAERRMGA